MSEDATSQVASTCLQIEYDCIVVLLFFFLLGGEGGTHLKFLDKLCAHEWIMLPECAT